MDHVCVVFPLLPGKTEEARAFQRELDTTRKSDYDRSERRIGITKEYWFVASVPGGDQLVVYMESPDFTRALGQFGASQDAFDLWTAAPDGTEAVPFAAQPAALGGTPLVEHIADLERRV